MATPTAEQLIEQLYLAYGSTLGQETVLMDYIESTSTTGFQKAVIPLELAASATDQSINLSNYVDTATIIGIKDRNGTGLLVGRTTGTSARLQIASNGFLAYKNGNSTPPTLYFDNVSGAEKAFTEIIVLGTSA